MASAATQRRDPEAAAPATQLVREREYEALAALPPAFGAGGTITAGNASQVSDGATAALLTTEDRAEGRVLAEIVGRAVVAGPDSTLHLRPAEASRVALQQHAGGLGWAQMQRRVRAGNDGPPDDLGQHPAFSTVLGRE